MASPVASKKRKAYTISEKLHVVDRIRNGETQAKVSREIGVSDSTIRGWLKDEAKLRGASSSLEDSGQVRKRARTAQDQQLESAMFTWFNQARSEGMPISGPVIQAQAKKIHQELRGSEVDFEASNGWLSRFKNRHAISQVTIRGEQRSADEAAAGAYPAELRKIVQEHDLSAEQIYNCDETALYFKMLPDKTLACKSDQQKTLGFKQVKDRITVLLCCNMAGTHKLAPLVIGKFGKPRCFHHVNMKSLPALYTHSKNAWMTSVIFEDWFHEEFVPSVRKHLRLNKKEAKAILLMDHCPAHPGVESLTSLDKKIKAVFLPKNTTSKLQPLDQGIIATLKRNYRRNLSGIMVNSKMSVSDYLRQLNLKEAIHLLGTSWSDVTKKTIMGCWRKGLGPAFEKDGEDSSDSEDFDGFSEEDLRISERRAMDNAMFCEEDLQSARQVFGQDLDDETLQNWISVDDDGPTYQRLTDEEIIESARNEPAITEEEDEEDESIVYEPPPAISEVLRSLDTVMRWIETSERGTVSKVMQVRNLMHDARADAREKAVQRRLTDFFTRDHRNDD
ncbi:jerky protein homolog-like [Mercenaria mercenaria]|uniref:jerky protein homolog-like n=1 Tax=Mercenaria mercenaria TaxID=6596 RepID=UPI00234EEDEC|nr:jerky protein homolog-like [Mercenaria mercenaria]